MTSNSTGNSITGNTLFEPSSVCSIASINLSMITKCLSYSELVRNNIIPNFRNKKK